MEYAAPVLSVVLCSVVNVADRLCNAQGLRCISVRGFSRVPERLDTMHWYDLVGSVGVILIAAGFLLLQLERVASNSLLYLIANALGAALILLSLMFEFNLSAFLMEAFWLGVSLMGLARRMQRQRPL
jgi:hypothetical protein